MENHTFSAWVYRPWVALGLLVQRLGVGGLTLWFGLEKLGKFRDLLPSFPDPLGIGSEVSLILVIVAQVPCALLVVAGCMTRWASVPPLITMLVAAFIVHVDDPSIYMRNALIYAVGFLAVLLAGPGRYSIDLWLLRDEKPIESDIQSSTP